MKKNKPSEKDKKKPTTILEDQKSSDPDYNESFNGTETDNDCQIRNEGLQADESSDPDFDESFNDNKDNNKK